MASFLLLTAGTVNAQYYTIGVTGENPKKLNTDGENPAVSLTGWSTLWSGNGTAAAAYSPSMALPFPFTFNGNVVTHFKASNSGSVTFDTASTVLAPYGNTALPSASVANNSINVLGVKPSSWVSGSTTYTSTIVTKSFGSAPNRQFWIQYNFFSEANINSGWTYWSVVLEETSNKVYIVDMKTLCVTTAGARCNNNVKMSAGLQMNSTTAYSINGSPNLGANNIATNIFDASDNKYYEFVSGTQPGLDLSVANVNNEAFTVAKLTQIYGSIRNMGSQVVTSMTLNYQIDGEAVVSSNLTGLSIEASGGVYSFTHATPLAVAAAGTKTLKVWATNVNGAADENTANDALSKSVVVAANLRVTLHEIFSSSTCGPCAPGNANYKAVVAGRDKNLFTSIKYQQDFPGTGDPYSTGESVRRRGYYSINSIPRMEIDGQWDQNAQSFTNALFTQYQTLTSPLAIQSTYRTKGNEVAVNVKLNAITALAANSKLYVAIIEGKTIENVKSNGETEFYHVMKKMVPSETGTLISDVQVGVEKEYNFSFTFPGQYKLAPSGQSPINLETEHSVEDFNDLEVIVFVQSSNKQVLQSAPSERLSYWATGLNEVNNALNTAVYPNPTAKSFVVSSPISGRTGLVRIMDLTGKEVAANQFVEFNNTEVDCSALKTGIYFVEIQTEGKTAVQKLVISK